MLNFVTDMDFYTHPSNVRDLSLQAETPGVTISSTPLLYHYHFEFPTLSEHRLPN